MIKIAITGAAGRMGRTVAEAVRDADDLTLGAALGHPDSDAIGDVIDDVRIARELVAEDFDVLVDFSVPAATLGVLEACVRHKKGMVIGTTGFDSDGTKRIAQAAERIPIVMSPNMSVGVNVTFKLIEAAAKALGADADVEVFEAHHRHKVDAPSGTAVRMGEILADALDRDLSTDARLRSRRHHRRAGHKDHRFPLPARRRHRRRTHGHVRRSRRAPGDHASRAQPHELCHGRPARRAIRRRARRGSFRCRGRPRNRQGPLTRMQACGLPFELSRLPSSPASSRSSMFHERGAATGEPVHRGPSRRINRVLGRSIAP